MLRGLDRGSGRRCGAIEAASTGTPPFKGSLTDWFRAPAGDSNRGLARCRAAADRFPAPGCGRRGGQAMPSGRRASTRVGRNGVRRRSLRATISARRRLVPIRTSPKLPPRGMSKVDRQARGRSGKSSITRAIVPSAPSRCSRSWVAIRLVRSSAPPGRHRRVDRDVGVDAGVEERLPEQHRLPVVADHRPGRPGWSRRVPSGSVPGSITFSPRWRRPSRRYSALASSALEQLRARRSGSPAAPPAPRRPRPGPPRR